MQRDVRRLAWWGVGLGLVLQMLGFFGPLAFFRPDDVMQRVAVAIVVVGFLLFLGGIHLLAATVVADAIRDKRE